MYYKHCLFYCLTTPFVKSFELKLFGNSQRINQIMILQFLTNYLNLIMTLKLYLTFYILQKFQVFNYLSNFSNKIFK
jgi:hypothetical protein